MYIPTFPLLTTFLAFVVVSTINKVTAGNSKREPWQMKKHTVKQQGRRETSAGPALKGEFRWAVLIELEIDTTLLGAILSESWILSESRSISHNKSELSDKNVAHAGFVKGALRDNRDTQTRIIDRILVHANSGIDKSKRLILLQTKEPFTFNEFVKDIALVHLDFFPYQLALPCTLVNWKVDASNGHLNLYQSKVTLRNIKHFRETVWNDDLLYEQEWTTACDPLTSAAAVCQGILTAFFLNVDELEEVLIEGIPNGTQCVPLTITNRLFLFVGRFTRWITFIMCDCSDIPYFRKMRMESSGASKFFHHGVAALLLATALLCSTVS